MVQKCIFFLVIAAIICNSYGQDPRCPPVDDPQKDVLYPDPDDCGGFLECAHGSLVPLKCYPGLYYNPFNEQCDYKWNVDCGARPTTAGPPQL